MINSSDPASRPYAGWRGTTRSPQETDRLGVRLASGLSLGDALALNGPLGAGKSHLARAIVRTLLRDPEAEVPSPSYTLVNVYQTPDFEIWHADLYRLGDPSEIDEILLADATEHGILLLEWAERWPERPARMLEIEIRMVDDLVRDISILPRGDGWRRLLDVLEQV